MKKFYCLVLFCWLLINNAHTQNTNFFYEKENNYYSLYVSNNNFYQVSLLLELQLQNLFFSEEDKSIFIIPAQTQKFKIGELIIDKLSRPHSFNYRYNFAMGNVLDLTYNDTVAYDLPFPANQSYLIVQGYNGKLSHKKENALDFNMPIGTPVIAAREGQVVLVVDHNTKNCASKDCEQYNNYITIMHNDETFASYLHISPNSAKFKVGAWVKRGDTIALSGNVGWSTGPHLHFVCFKGGFKGPLTLETYFKTGNGTTVEILQETKTYSKNY